MLTTFDTVASDWKKNSRPSVALKTLFSFTWHRVVLDEGKSLVSHLITACLHDLAHTIRTEATVLSIAACSLNATRRWSVSGTPIQNRLMDLATILKFLRVYPFDNPATFEQEILQPWLKCEPDGLLRLRLLVRSIGLCRSNSIANLPMRFDQIHHLEFSPAEADLYETTKRRTDSFLEEAISANRKRQGSNLNGLRWLNSLRLICNHGVMHRKIGSPEALSKLVQGPRKVNSLIAQELFDELLSTGAAICAGCSVNLTEVLAEDLDSNLQPELSECLFLFCGVCSREKTSKKYRVTCQHGASCRAFKVSIGGLSTPCRRQKLSIVMNETDTPTKIKALLLDLQKYGRKTKR